ncbi:BTAD domain-containing putative transcriptional regulator [Actinophytocola sp.]|uniref:AfsR/SARP family transcriptional regulator n=1 Tax=Actinophytocola sp. TaxID=1872138 RepID=UPI003899E850
MFGRFEVVGPRGTIRITARRQQIILATLVWHANRVVGIESLIDALWGATPPDTARSQVHICVSGIRKRLARSGLHQLVGTESPGYLARVGTGELDLHVFDSLVTRGRTLMGAGQPDEASRCLAEALALWRGEPFAGIGSERVQSMVTQLVERYITVSEDYFQLQNRLGRSAHVVGDLMALVERHPFRERLRGELMVALCHTGRQAEALREYRHTRALFVDELGVEPSWELRRLEQDILANRVTAPA